MSASPPIPDPAGQGSSPTGEDCPTDAVGLADLISSADVAGPADNDHPTCEGSPTADPLWERTQILIGAAGVARLAGSHVLLAGLGGVGAFTAEALARAGVGRLTLIDEDTVAPSNLNRQLVALTSTIGRPKVAVMAERIAAINPRCQLRLRQVFIAADNLDDLLAERPDLVVDAIDSLTSKVALIATALRLGLPILSSMGAGGRLDPTAIQVGDLMDTRICALARAVRSRLRRLGYGRGVQVVWSAELPRPPAPPAPTTRGRPRAVNGTISYMPALFGLTLAGLAIQRLLDGEPTPADSRPG